MEYLYSDNIGLIHLIFSLLAVVTGTMVLVRSKGTKSHKKVGWVYTVSMIGLLITAFFIYNLYGKFGIFHWLGLVSTITLLGGMIPMILKKPKAYISLHLSFMYWSVFGLYGAFVAELLVRIPRIVIEDGAPNPMFYNLVGVGVFITMGFGYFFFYKNKQKWLGFDKSQESKDESFS